MRIDGVALGVGRAPAAALAAPAGGPAVDVVAHLAVGLARDVVGALRSVAGRWARVLARDAVTVLRTRGPAWAALLTRGRPLAGPVQLVDGTGARAPRTSAEPVVPLRRIPAPRAATGQPRAPRPPAPGGRHRELALPADPTAPSIARALLTEAVGDWGLDDELHQDAAMVVTELVANAVDHACTASTVTLDLDEQRLRVAVRDERPGRSLRALPVDPTAPRGRGLQMIEALSGAWGVTQDVGGKTVWAVLPRS